VVAAVRGQECFAQARLVLRDAITRPNPPRPLDRQRLATGRPGLRRPFPKQAQQPAQHCHDSSGCRPDFNDRHEVPQLRNAHVLTPGLVFATVKTSAFRPGMGDTPPGVEPSRSWPIAGG